MRKVTCGGAIAGLVDEIGFSIQPTLLGAGIPALRQMGRRVSLELIEARAVAEKSVIVRYRAAD